MHLRQLRQLSYVSLVIGLALFSGGAGMRVYVTLHMAETERRLMAARPERANMALNRGLAGIQGRTGEFTSPSSPLSEFREGEKIGPTLSGLPAQPPVRAGENHKTVIAPADGPPTEIRLPDLGLWNRLEPVTAQLTWQDGQIVAAWEVRDAGWHVPNGWPGKGQNVVIAGHSPSRDPGVWSRSVFRQLAYLNPGDLIELTAGSHVYTYRIHRVFAIPEVEAGTADAVAWITPGERERLTLITCWPPHTAAYRILVIADPVRSIEKTEKMQHE